MAGTCAVLGDAERDKQLVEAEVSRSMSLVKMEVSCNKFQANVFDQSRCQNCFKSRELHLMTRQEMEQVKPIYASWLCLAPEGLDFDNPMQRSRKWQRRFFILYEHGCLEFALDDLPGTIPHGTVNMHYCSDVIDAEGRTGQKNTLCIITPDQDIYIRGDSKEIINGWCEQLLLFRQTNEPKQRNKGSWMPVFLQEANTEVVEDELCNPSEDTEDINVDQDVSVASADADSFLSNCAETRIGNLDIKQETYNVDTHQAEGGSVQLPLKHELAPLNSHGASTDLCTSDLPLNRSALHSLCWQDDDDDDAESCAKKHSKASSLTKYMTQGNLQLETQEDENYNDSPLIMDSMADEDCWTHENEEQYKTCTQFSSSRSHVGHMEKSVGLLELPESKNPTLRRWQSLEVNCSESVMTPDLLNFKKGWLFMDDHGQWRKYWFVLSAHSLRYYFDSGAEELVGEIDLTTCHRVSELHNQRKFAFEIRTHRKVCKIYTMTAGMRQNWIQALTKNIQEQNAPDVASIPDNWPFRVGLRSGPDVTQESMSLSCSPDDECCTKRRSAVCRCQSHPKKSSWTDMLTQESTREQEREVQYGEQGINRRRGREERRQKYAMVMGSSVSSLDDINCSAQENQEQERIREIEEYWQQVEQMAVREEKRVQLYPVCQSQDCFEQKQLLELYRKMVEELITQSESADRNYSQDHEHNTDKSLLQEPTCDLETEWEPQKMASNTENYTLTDKSQEPTGFVHLKDLRSQQINDLLDLQVLSKSSSEFTNETKRKGDDGITSDKSIKSHGSLDSCQASRNFGDDPPWARISGVSLLTLSGDDDSDQAKVKLLSQKVEFLMRQNEDLNQRNQELLNQLAEADREIDRLKAELSYQLNDHQPELESVVACLELELARSCGKLQEAKVQLKEMEDRLKDTHQTLKLKETTLRGLGFLTVDSENKITFPEIIDRLHQCVQVLEFKVSELESQQWLSTLTCKDLQTQNTLPVKSEIESTQKVLEDDKMLESKLEPNIPLSEGSTRTQDQQHWNRIETFAAELEKRSNLFHLLLEVTSQLAGSKRTDSVLESEAVQMNHKVLSRLQLENDIWKSFVNTLKSTTSNNIKNEEAAYLLQSAEMKLNEVEVYLSALSLYKSTNSNPQQLSSNSEYPSMTSSTNTYIVGLNNGKMEKEQKDAMWKGLNEHIEQRLILIDHVTSKLESFANNEHFCGVTNSYLKSHTCNNTNVYSTVISVVMDIMAACLVEKLSQSETMQKSVAIQNENQEMSIEQNKMAVDENPMVNEDTEKETITRLKSHIKELEHLLSERLMSLQQQHAMDKERLKASFEQNITLLKESQRKATEVLLLKHQQEQELIQEDKETKRLLTEEVSACLTVIEAMKRTHKEELEKMVQKECHEKMYNGDTDVDVILKNHSEELSAVQRELDALSEQYTRKCLENVRLTEVLEAERDTLQQCQCQIQALSVYNQELKNHLAKEIIRLSTVAKDDCSQLVYDGEQYELIVKLRVKECCQEQEIDTLKNELYSTKMDQKVALEKLHKTQIELNMVKETAEQQISQLKENLRLVYQALEESIKKKMPTTPLVSSS